MNYKKKYEEALERAKDMLAYKEVRQEDMEYLFPELKESEDERIRKELIENFKWFCGDYPETTKWGKGNGLLVKDIIAWLEKQNKQSYSNIPSRETILAIWELGNDWKELTNGSISTEYGTQLEYIQKHWQESEYYLKEKQDKQTQLDYEHADIPQKDFAPIEPKFKVGDKVTMKGNNTVYTIGIIAPDKTCWLKHGSYEYGWATFSVLKHYIE